MNNSSAYKKALSSLNDAQLKAVKTTDGPVLVIAGPGTGKTQLLTTRIAHILATTDTLPQNILCLTFTDSAAQTMRGRLANLIGQAAYDVSISTYHAFGSELIRRYPDYFMTDSDLQPVDDLGIDSVLRDIVARLAYSNPLKYADTYLYDIKILISDAKRALLTPDDLAKVASDNLKFISQTNPLVQKHLKGIARIDKKSIALFRELRDVINETTQSSDVIPAEAGIQPISIKFQQELAEAVAAAEQSGKTNTITAWKNTWLAKDANAQFIVDGAKTNQKLIAAADIYQQYLDKLKKRGLFDYDDMILRAVHALETNDDLRYTLQEQYQYILLDEFQDTNGAQLRLVQLLTDNPVHEGRPNVLAVGDDDQAIYAFQGADYSHMLQFKDMYQGVLPVPLTENYRSHASILQTARAVAEQIEQRLHHHFPAIEKTLTAAGKDLPKNAVIERREAASDIDQFAWAAAKIKQLVDEGIPPSEIAVLAPKHKYLEPLVPFLQQADIPVRYDKRENVLDDPKINQLLRMSELVTSLAGGMQQSANALWPQVLSFDFWGLPTSQIWQLSWKALDQDRSWTEELLNDENLKPVALFFIRLSQLGGTETLETMLDYLIGSETLDLNEPGLGKYTSPYYAYNFSILRHSRAGGNPVQNSAGQSSASQLNLLDLDSRLRENDGGLEKSDENDKEKSEEDSKQSDDFWNLLTNLIVLRARLKDYKKDNEERLTLADLLEFTAAHRAADLKILNTSPYASASDAVQLMTAFKSKGMEFTAVFVLAVSDEAWGSKARAQGSRVSLPPNLQFIRYAGATNDERLRLFYVAITRAKSQLYLVNYSANYAGKGTVHLKYLNEISGADGTVQSPLLPEGQQQILPAQASAAQPTTELSAYWQQRHQSALSQEDMQILLLDRLKQFQLSPTHVNDFTDLVHSGPEPFFLKTVLRFPSAQQPEMQFGNAMHETLEWIHKAAKKEGTIPTEAAVQKTFAKNLSTKNLTAAQNTQFADRGTAALQAYLTQRQATISPHNMAEHSFRNEGVFIGSTHMAGKIDKLIINPADKTLVIVDYKTGQSHNRWTNDLKLLKYRHQLYLYKALVEGSHTYKGYRVTDAYLEFVEPDEDGVIQELHLDMDDDEYERSKQLATAVWQRIKTLDLPDITEYPQNINGVQLFEEYLLMNSGD